MGHFYSPWASTASCKESLVQGTLPVDPRRPCEVLPGPYLPTVIIFTLEQLVTLRFWAIKQNIDNCYKYHYNTKLRAREEKPISAAYCPGKLIFDRRPLDPLTSSWLLILINQIGLISCKNTHFASFCNQSSYFTQAYQLWFCPYPAPWQVSY